METGIPVKNEIEALNNKEFVARSRLSKKEVFLGDGRYFKPIFAFLFWSNSMVFAARYDFLNNSKFFVLSLPISYLFAHFSSKLMRDNMYLEATRIDSDSQGSARKWEKIFDKTN